MEHEIIDWYDENGHYKGKVDKAIAHKLGLWHKSVHVWIINEKKQILMQKRCSKKKFFPNYWDCSFAGHVGAGESSLQSALREGKEELGIDLKTQDLKFLFTIKEDFVWNDIRSREFADVYICEKQVNVEDLTYQKEEVESAKYFNIEEIFNQNKGSNIIPHTEEYRKLYQFIKKNDLDNELF